MTVFQYPERTVRYCFTSRPIAIFSEVNPTNILADKNEATGIPVKNHGEKRMGPL